MGTCCHFAYLQKLVLCLGMKAVESMDSSANKMTVVHIDDGPVASSIAMKNRIFINVPCPRVALQK